MFKRIAALLLIMVVLAAGYLGVKAFLSSGYIASAVSSFAAGKLNCDVTIGRAQLNPFRSLLLGDVCLSYRKADDVYEIFRAESAELKFDAVASLGNVRFESVHVTNALLKIGRDPEGWFTAGRIILPGTLNEPLNLKMDVDRLNVWVASMVVPFNDLSVELTSALPKVHVSFQGDVYRTGVRGSGYLMLEEDPRLEGCFAADHLKIENIEGISWPGDLKLSGRLQSRMSFQGRASSRSLMQRGSYVTVEELGGVLPDGKKMFSTASMSALYEPPSGERPRSLLRVEVADAFLDTDAWLHAYDSPDKLIFRERAYEIVSAAPDAEIEMSGKNLVLSVPIGELPFEQFSGHVTKLGDSIGFDAMWGSTCGGEITARWTYHRSETTSRYEGAVEVKNAALSELITHTPIAKSKVHGILSGELKFRSIASREMGPRGEGFVKVTAGDVWQLPMFSDIPNVLELSPEQLAPPQQIDATFTLDASGVHIAAINLTCEALVLHGTGDISFSGEVNLHLEAIQRVPRERALPILDDFLGLIADVFTTKHTKIEVFGNLTRTSARRVGAVHMHEPPSTEGAPVKKETP